jgi:predicted hydrolase (HD superfamily)
MSNVIITAVVGKGFQAPETIEVDGVKLPLLDKAFALGINADKKVIFQAEKTGEKRALDVSEKAYEHVLQQTIQCSYSKCLNRQIKGLKCWDHGDL